ncbi:maleylacetoacetate isomerase [Brucella sp. NM4]|uniref:maleylacetoacetate isomerase n=1 Tax=Brucella/Ochrobactrum group TaxID=2826938 RepID=UPI0024BCBB64|nr:maleylacetoacetate isomerase [Brucella sp. NM4]WHS30635.1 maleylacetoacetate isomerase [Brucella sp. NM4]WHT45381.1 maleylacetoacetate isomerase [Ochrobactrum sp. SSR]
MKFFGYFRSSSAYRCRIAFNLKGVTPDFVSVHLRRDGGQQKRSEYRAVNPQALVPTLEDGSFILTQSLAIIEWLDETHPTPPLLPADTNQRASVRAFAQAIACDIHPLQNLRVLDYLKTDLGHDQKAADEWCRRWISEGLAACELLLQNRPFGGPYVSGEAPGLADLCLIPQLFSADRFGVETTAFRQLKAIRELCETHDAFALAHPSKQPDAEI